MFSTASTSILSALSFVLFKVMASVLIAAGQLGRGPQHSAVSEKNADIIEPLGAFLPTYRCWGFQRPV